MAKKSKKSAPKRPKIVLPVPANEAAARKVAKRIVELLAEIGKVDADHDARNVALKAAHGDKVGPLHDELAASVRVFEEFAKRDAETLFPGDKRSADWPEAVFGYRTHPAAIEIAKDADEDAIVAALLKGRKIKFLRRKTELNREALLDDPDGAKSIAGIEIVQGESFFVATPGKGASAVMRIGKTKTKIKVEDAA